MPDLIRYLPTRKAPQRCGAFCLGYAWTSFSKQIADFAAGKTLPFLPAFRQKGYRAEAALKRWGNMRCFNDSGRSGPGVVGLLQLTPTSLLGAELESPVGLIE